MKRWHIAVVLIAALLLVGGAGAVKPDKEPVDKVVLVHYKDGVAAKPAPVLNAAAFKLLGVRWKTTAPVAFHVDPSNNDNVAGSAVAGEVAASFAAWDTETSRDLFSVQGAPAKGSQVAQNYENVVFWEDMADSRIIAVTTYWFNRATKAFVEADIKMNDNDQYQMIWGIDPDGEGSTASLKNAYDVRNIATHEVGHVCGLADLYGPRDAELTMYGYGAQGEVRKISLAPGDIAGLEKLYGA